MRAADRTVFPAVRNYYKLKIMSSTNYRNSNVSNTADKYDSSELR